MSSTNSVIFPTNLYPLNFSHSRPRSPSDHDLLSLTSSSMDNTSFSTGDEQTMMDYYTIQTDKKSVLYDPSSVQQISAILPLLTPPASSDSIYCQDPWQLKRQQQYMCDPYCCTSSPSSFDMCCSFPNSSESISSCYSPTCHECNLMTPSESPSMAHNVLKNLLVYDPTPTNYFHPYKDSDLQPSTLAAATKNTRKSRGYNKTKRQYSIDSTSSESESLSDKTYSSSAPRRYKCSVCPKRFTRPSSLATHMHSHTGEKPYECEHEGCGRRFSVVSNLRRHAKIHTTNHS
ncbi:hypothetical protein G6F46_011823 [Rhizopus delemar]|uniref:C2H2-type domain-containing protein n=3 Tax=Rhizopus TaxID=4842 RepID=I1BZC9_RHIO9|nr:hypothetical protein RO3G_06264 [Rhizopus delemar RA 99-880]KAG1443998.1 hypothetical protein G6F55_012478 [Rhizopus delemar]KAG1533175.1 hypothetical protein G6F51_012749 [Rhizopus arrhizus]KAG1494443.1 hypothetical protein G6F53_012574 [Rhizopus delemar]KAG1503426.1 hypothetical protein G6F54_001692 [Rhizopus delemar]|eukprot:EIE81559.1 hypothetical protein RO3G_06264 [Rhizopus delemar RA 99-880]